MNITQLIELNAFRKAVAHKGSENAKFEVLDFASIKNAENMDVKKLLEAGKHLVIVGVVDGHFSSRPIVYNTHDGNYPQPKKVAAFKLLDVRENIVELQDTVDIVSSIKYDLEMTIKDVNDLELVNIEQVYGRAWKKGHKLEPHLTLAEVISQLAPRYGGKDTFLFYVCDSAEDCGNLTDIAGYHAYRVAVYAPKHVSGIQTDLTADNISAEEIV